MNTKIKVLVEKIKNLFLNYPLVLLMSLATVITIIYGIEFEPKKDDGFFLVKLGLTFSLGISLQFALKMLSQRFKNGLIWQIAGVLFLIGYFFILPKTEKDFSEVHAFIIGPAFILSHLLVSFVAFTKTQNTEHNFWQYNKNLFINLFLTIIFTGVLVGGVELAILAVEKLFSLKFESKIYFETFVSLAIFGSTLIFLLFNETGLDYLEKEGKYPEVLKFFTQFVLIPLLFIYVVILYFYTAKIVVNWELPRGWVSYLVLAYSIVGILALLLVHPLKELKAKSWIVVFSKIFYFTLIPLIVLLFTAIFTRVLQYGYTEARYFVLLISLWLTTVVLYFILVKKDTIKFIPISLFCFGLFALLFPYLNAFSVAKRSQENQLVEILNQNNLLVNGKINFNKQIVDSVKTEIDNKFEFLTERKDQNFIKPFLEAKAIKKMEKDKYWYISLFTNVNYVSNSVSKNNNYLRVYTEAKVISLENYDYAISSKEYSNNNDFLIGKDKFEFDNSLGTNPTYTLTVNNTTKDIVPQIKSILSKYKNASQDVLVEDLSTTVEIENYQIKIIFQSINWYKNDNTYHFDNGMYLIKKK